MQLEQRRQIGKNSLHLPSIEELPKRLSKLGHGEAHVAQILVLGGKQLIEHLPQLKVVTARVAPAEAWMLQRLAIDFCGLVINHPLDLFQAFLGGGFCISRLLRGNRASAAAPAAARGWLRRQSPSDTCTRSLRHKMSIFLANIATVSWVFIRLILVRS